MKNLFKRTSTSKLIALVLATLMLATALPLSVFAAPIPYEDGTLLLKMANMSAASVTYNPYGVTLSNGGAVETNFGTDKKELITTTTNQWGAVGINTDLPFGSDTAYTVEYYVKLEDPSLGMGAIVGFGQNKAWQYYGHNMYIYASGAKMGVHNKWWVDIYAKKGTTSYGTTSLGENVNVWESQADADGFVRCILTFDGRYLGLTVGGVTAEYDLLTRKNNNDTIAQANWINTLSVIAGYTNINSGSSAKPEKNQKIMEVKDISVYSGIVDPDALAEPTGNFLTFETLDGKVLKKVEIPAEGLSYDELPDFDLDGFLGWNNKATGELVEGPVTFTESTALVANQKFLTFESGSGKVLGTLAIPEAGLTLADFPNFGLNHVWDWYNKVNGEIVEATTIFTESATLVAHQEFLILQNSAGKIMKTYEIPAEGLELEEFPDLGLINLLGWFDKDTGVEVTAPATFTESAILAARQEFDKNGALLLQLSGMDYTAVTYQSEGVNATGNYALGISKKTGNASTYVVNQTAVNNNWGAWGVLTDLPLTTESVYTIEYYVKLNGSTAVFAGFPDNVSYPSAGANVQLRMNGDVKNYYKTIDVYMRKDGSNAYGANIGNVWTNRADSEGFVRFVLTIDNGILSFQVGDTVVPQSWNLENVASNAVSTVAKFSDFGTKTLGLTVGFANAGDGVIKPGNSTEIMEVKNISIYAGKVNPDVQPQPQYVTFENEKGAVLRRDLVDSEGTVIESFPEASTANTTPIWLDKATGKLVTPPTAENPLTLTEPTTFVLYEKRVNDSDVLAIQYSESVDGKQSIRFVGGVYNTDCKGVGFDITVRYKNADGEIVEMFYRLTGTAVYDAINATENGTMANATAADLGAFYLFGAVLDGVPTDLGQIDFEVTSFKMIGKLQLRINGETETVSFINGAINNTLVPLA